MFVLLGGLIGGCNGLIGTPDLFYVSDAPQGGGDASTNPNTPRDGSTSEDGAVPACVADTQSDSKNCGSCGHDCLGGACNQGVCAPVRINGTGGGEPWAIALDEANVYYTDISGTTGSLYKVPKGGGTPAKLASTSNHLIYDLKLDGTHAYFSSGSFGNGGAVERVLLGGGTKEAIATNGPGASDPRGVSLDTQYVYWVNTDTPYDVKRALKQANATVGTLAAGETNPTLTFVEGNVLWWTSKSAGKIRRCTLPACTDRYDLTTMLAEPDTLGESRLSLFYNSGGTVMQIAKNALLGPGAVVATGQSLPVAFAADDRELYWIDLGDYTKSWVDGAIRRCPILTGAADCAATVGGSGQTVARPGAQLARGIAIDATAIYWTEQKAGAVYRLAR
jgi:hypothetical protein